MQVYVNYPYPHITIHKNDACQQVRMHRKAGQRIYTVRTANADELAGEFLTEKFVFRSERRFNDLWLDISLATPERDLEFVRRFQSIVGQRYKRLMHAPVSIHCE